MLADGWKLEEGIFDDSAAIFGCYFEVRLIDVDYYTKSENYIYTI